MLIHRTNKVKAIYKAIYKSFVFRDLISTLKVKYNLSPQAIRDMEIFKEFIENKYKKLRS